MLKNWESWGEMNKSHHPKTPGQWQPHSEITSETPLSTGTHLGIFPIHLESAMTISPCIIYTIKAGNGQLQGM